MFQKFLSNDISNQPVLLNLILLNGSKNVFLRKTSNFKICYLQNIESFEVQCDLSWSLRTHFVKQSLLVCKTLLHVGVPSSLAGWPVSMQIN